MQHRNDTSRMKPCVLMNRLLLISLIVLSLIGFPAGAADKSLILYMPMDEGAGSTVGDASPYGNNGEIVGNAVWIPGQSGLALEIVGGSHVVVPEIPEYDVTSAVTVMTWMRTTTVTTWARLIDKSQWQSNGFDLVLNQGNHIPGFEFFVNNTTSQVNAMTPVDDGEWHFIVGTYGDQTLRIYVDGIQEGEGQSTGGVDINPNDWPIMLGAEASSNGGQQYVGALDEVALFSRELSAEEIQDIFENGMPVSGLASKPQPQDEAIDVPRDAILSWMASDVAVTHNVYWGTSPEEVSDNAASVRVAEGLDDSRFVPEGLEFDRTYFWRVDEVNGAPDFTVFEGDVWSFTVEPTALPIEHITATASASMPQSGPENTINGSGLNELDQHDVTTTTMWIAPSPTPWIQYVFDKVYKLHEMVVWNSNQTIEAFVSFGVKELSIDYSIDGESWATLNGVVTLNQATGSPDYVANTTVDLGGIMAKMVKLSVVSGYGIIGQTSLSEVRFLTLPVTAREPHPANGALTEDLDVTLSWRAGREAALHDVQLSTDQQAVANGNALVTTVSETTYAPESLMYGTAYYWSVTEVNQAETPTHHGGDLWRFTIPDYGVIDDFESYSGDAGQEIYMVWLDGYGGDASLGGSTTGHIDSPFVETTLVHPNTGGRQSMPIVYDNNGNFTNIDGNVNSPTFSEAVREFDSPQDWTRGGAQILVLTFAGSAFNDPGEVYVKINGVKTVISTSPTDLQTPLWSQGTVDLASVNSNLTDIRTLTVGIDGPGTGTLYLDDIRLYRIAPVVPVPVDPGTGDLVAHYALENTLQDSSGNGYDGTAALNAAYAIGPDSLGSVLVLPGGAGDYVDLPIGSLINTLTDATFAMWVDFSGQGGQWQRIFDFGSGTDQFVFISPQDGNSALRFEINGPGAGTNVISRPGTLASGWHHVAGVIDSTRMEMTLYLDGTPVAQGPTDALPTDLGDTTQNWLGRSQFSADPNFNGSLDEFRIYRRTLSPGEVRYLAGDR
jgi:hypothetical protein